MFFKLPPSPTDRASPLPLPMKTRREFMKLMAVAGTVTATVPPPSALASAAPALASPSSVRDAWKAAARRMATPLLTALAAGELRAHARRSL